MAALRLFDSEESPSETRRGGRNVERLPFAAAAAAFPPAADVWVWVRVVIVSLAYALLAFGV